MLQLARRRLATLPEPVRRRIRLLLCDMRAPAIGNQLRLVVTTSFGHLLEEPEQLRCLRWIREAMAEPDGRLLVYVPDLELDPSSPGHWQASSGDTTVTCTTCSRTDHVRRIHYADYRFSVTRRGETGRTLEIRYCFVFHSAESIAKLARNTGWHVVSRQVSPRLRQEPRKHLRVREKVYELAPRG
jgi:hypothetical protein